MKKLLYSILFIFSSLNASINLTYSTSSDLMTITTEVANQLSAESVSNMVPSGLGIDDYDISLAQLNTQAQDFNALVDLQTEFAPIFYNTPNILHEELTVCNSEAQLIAQTCTDSCLVPCTDTPDRTCQYASCTDPCYSEQSSSISMCQETFDTSITNQTAIFDAISLMINDSYDNLVSSMVNFNNAYNADMAINNKPTANDVISLGTNQIDVTITRSDTVGSTGGTNVDTGGTNVTGNGVEPTPPDTTGVDLGTGDTGTTVDDTFLGNKLDSLLGEMIYNSDVTSQGMGDISGKLGTANNELQGINDKLQGISDKMNVNSSDTASFSDSITSGMSLFNGAMNTIGNGISSIEGDFNGLKTKIDGGFDISSTSIGKEPVFETVVFNAPFKIKLCDTFSHFYPIFFYIFEFIFLFASIRIFIYSFMLKG